MNTLVLVASLYLNWSSTIIWTNKTIVRGSNIFICYFKGIWGICLRRSMCWEGTSKAGLRRERLLRFWRRIWVGWGSIIIVSDAVMRIYAWSQQELRTAKAVYIFGIHGCPSLPARIVSRTIFQICCWPTHHLRNWSQLTLSKCRNMMNSCLVYLLLGSLGCNYMIWILLIVFICRKSKLIMLILRKEYQKFVVRN